MQRILIAGGVILAMCGIVGVYIASDNTVIDNLPLANKHIRIDPASVSVSSSQYCTQETRVTPVPPTISYSCSGDCKVYSAVFSINQTSPKVTVTIKSLNALVSRSNKCEIFHGKIADALSGGSFPLTHLGIPCSTDTPDTPNPEQSDIDETFCEQADTVVRSLAGAQALLISQKREAIAENIRAEMEKRQWHSNNLFATGIFSFRGSQFGDTVADVLVHEGEPQDACQNDAKECDVSPSERPSDNLTYYFIGGRMMAFVYIFPFSDGEQMLAFLTHEYGNPTTTEEQEATTGAGEQISYSLSTWNTPDGPLVLKGRYQTLDQGALTFNEEKLNATKANPFGSN